ncbi:MAG: hypothetical protein QGG54_20235, partial [Gammaproteobacteria bacterium]|nr:hypothetical protein [Gammaproteobacteria bacterium]
MSLTGSSADRRITLAPAEYSTVLYMLAERLAKRAEISLPQLAGSTGSTQMDSTDIDEMAEQLWQARGRSLVVCATNDVGTQCLVNAINHLLGNYGVTVDIQRPSYQWQGNDSALQALIQSMQAGRVNALIVADANPAYSLPNSGEFIEALKKVPLTISLAPYVDETAALTKYVCPVHHTLESWNDAETVSGVVSVSQPTLTPLGQTRSLRECLSAWLGDDLEDLAIIQAHWKESIYPRGKKNTSFQNFWDQAVHDGFVQIAPRRAGNLAYRQSATWPESLSMVTPNGQIALVLYEKVGMRDGRHAYNPWLHELPDPITKAVWDNYVCMAPSAASQMSVQEGDIVAVSDGKNTIELPVQIQPGQ